MLTVVTGPPCAGKSTYVQSHAKTDDVVIDLDVIAYALTCGRGDHDYPLHVRHVALNARAAAIRAALPMSAGLDVWVIHTKPERLDWVAYKQHGARIVRLDPGIHEVLRRCEQERPASVVPLIHEWYSLK